MQSQNDGRRISYEELKKHSTYTDAWISINGVVYDITGFIQKHPFGDTFMGNLGTECGGLFSSAHVNTNVECLLQNDSFREKNNIVVVGPLDVLGAHLHKRNKAPYLDRVVYRDTSTDKFWLDLKAEVKAYLKRNKESIHYGPLEGTLYLAYYLGIYALLSYLTWIRCSYLASALLGFHMLCAVANVSHMDTHYGFTRQRWLNFIAGHIFDLGGMSRLEWKIAHQTHHNQPHSSVDHQTNSYDDDIHVRIHRYINRKPHHRYQHIYFWLLISMYLLFRVIATSFWMVKNREFIRHKREVVAHVLARVMLFAPVFYCAHLHGWGRALTLLLIYAASYSYSAFALLYNDYKDTHKVLDNHNDASTYHNKLSWAEVQVRTSNDWYPTNLLMRFVEFHYGYFNYHIEHHLFPTLKPSLLKKISPIVREVCRRHGVPYIRTTFLDVQVSLQKHLVEMGSFSSQAHVDECKDES